MNKYIIAAGLAFSLIGLAMAVYLLVFEPSASAIPDGPDTRCRVVEYNVGNTQTCTIECAWAKGYEGYSTSTPTTCANGGKIVSRSVTEP